MRILALTLLIACGGASDDAKTDSGTDATQTTTTGTTATTGTTTTTATGCEGITPEVTDLSLAELDTMLGSKDFELINVHIPVNGQIAGTDADIAYTNVTAIADHLGGDKSAKVVLYCMTGPMSKIATEELVGLGYCNVYDLPDGMAQWDAAGYPME